MNLFVVLLRRLVVQPLACYISPSTYKIIFLCLGLTEKTCLTEMFDPSSLESNNRFSDFFSAQGNSNICTSNTSLHREHVL